MPDLRRCRRLALFTAVGAVSSALLLPVLALVRDTTGHDWYAADRLTLAQLMLGVGFEPYSVTTYRAANGKVMKITRIGLSVYGEPIRARARILSTVGNHAGLGAVAGGAGGALLLLTLGSGGSGRRRTGVLERAAATEWPVSRRLWNRDGVIDGVSLPGNGEARIGLVVLSPTDVEGVAHVQGFVDVGAPLPGGGIGPEQLAPGAEAARRALALTAPQGGQRAVEQDAESTKAVDATNPPADRGGPQAGEVAATSQRRAGTEPRKRVDRQVLKPVQRGVGRTRAKKGSPGRRQNSDGREPKVRRPGPKQDLY